MHGAIECDHADQVPRSRIRCSSLRSNGQGHRIDGRRTPFSSVCGESSGCDGPGSSRGEIRHEPAGPLRIGSPESVLSYRLHEVLTLFRKRYPKVKPFFYPESQEKLSEALESGKLDSAISNVGPISTPTARLDRHADGRYLSVQYTESPSCHGKEGVSKGFGRSDPALDRERLLLPHRPRRATGIRKGDAAERERVFEH
jgi:DNA-binding transcriptional LysR family regulator